MIQPLYFTLLAILAPGFAAPSDLDKRIHQKVDPFAGSVSLYAENLQNGKTYELKGSEPVRTASTIKLPIMIECFFEQAAGKISWTEPVKIADADKVSGSGIVQDFLDGTVLPFRDLLQVMIVLSDNTATNLILDRIGGNAVNDRMAQLGYVQTRVMRKILGDGNALKPVASGVTTEGEKPENAKWGLGRSSPKEMVGLLKLLYEGKLVSPEASLQMIKVLKSQRDHNGIGRDLNDIPIASKSGALDHLRSDVGIVYVPGGPIAMAITVDNIPAVNWTPDNPAELLISALSADLIEGLSGTQ